MCTRHFVVGSVFISFYGFFFVKFSGNHDRMGVADVYKAKVQTMFSSSSLYWLLLPPPPTAGGRGASIVKENNILWRRLIAMDKNRQNWKKILCNIRRQTSIKDFPNFGWIETGKNLIWKCGAHFLEYRRSLFKGKP